MHEAAVMLVINSDGLILGVSRKNDPTKFGLCGGKIEEGETAIQAAIRETFEETGIYVDAVTYLYERIEPAELPNGLEFKTYCFYANTWKGEPYKSEEGDVKWITENDLANGAFPEYNMNTLAAFRILYPNVHIQ